MRSSFGRWRLERVARRFTVPPMPSHGPLPCDVAKKCHSAGIPKSDLWLHRFRKFLLLYFMSGARGVAGCVWGWVSVDRRLFHRCGASVDLELSCLETLLSLELEVNGSSEGILYDEMYIMIIEK